MNLLWDNDHDRAWRARGEFNYEVHKVIEGYKWYFEASENSGRRFYMTGFNEPEAAMRSIQELEDAISRRRSAILDAVWRAYYRISEGRCWHKATCDVRGAGADGLSCECGFAAVEDLLRHHEEVR